MAMTNKITITQVFSTGVHKISLKTNVKCTRPLCTKPVLKTHAHRASLHYSSAQNLFIVLVYIKPVCSTHVQRIS